MSQVDDKGQPGPSVGFWRSVWRHVADELKGAGVAFAIGGVIGGTILGTVGLKYFGVDGMLTGALAGFVIGGLVLLVGRWMAGGLLS